MDREGKSDESSTARQELMKSQLAPNVFWAYHASSGPVEAIYDFWSYFYPIQLVSLIRKPIQHPADISIS
jgi:hypothetical protein